MIINVKQILKTLLSRTFLKKAFLFYNKLKIKTWDNIFFPEHTFRTSDFDWKKESNPFLDQKVSTGHLQKMVQQGLKLWQDPKWKQDEYLFSYKKEAYLDPVSGWAVTLGHSLIYPSLGFSRASYVHKPSLVATYFRKPKIVRLGRIISLRDTGEENYFHFFNDVLAKLFFLQDHRIPLERYTIVISNSLFNKEYFQYFFGNTWMKKLNWYVQKDEWVLFNEAIFCKPLTHTKKYFERAADLIPKSEVSKGSRNIFLFRGKNTLRYIENMQEVTTMVVKAGFELVDTASLPFLEQVRLFENAEHVFAVHGAGITNILFRRGKPMSLLEFLHPFEYFPFHYIMLANLFGYHYEAIIGEEGTEKSKGGFRVNLSHLDEMMKKFGLS